MFRNLRNSGFSKLDVVRKTSKSHDAFQKTTCFEFNFKMKKPGHPTQCTLKDLKMITRHAF